MKKIFTLVFLLSVLHAAALNSTHFTVQRITSPYFVVDGNSPATGPVTAYVGFKITNTSATTYTNLKFTINSISTSVVGQNYSVVSPSSGISAIGTLAAGESKVCYFYVSYPANTTPQATFNYTLADAVAGTKTGTFLIVNRSAISANAGGLATQTINNQDLIGGIVYDDVTYTLGNIRNGDEADFQVSVSTLFDPTKLVLMKTQVIASTVPGVTNGTTDLLYFTTTANQSSGTVTIRWTFRISAFNFTALILPYAGATSGASNYKYSISTDLGGGTPIVISSSANPLLISKTSDKVTYGTSNTALFTVTIQNPGGYPISVDRITDQVPAGFTYQALDGSSQVTNSNSTSVPTAGATGTITFEGGVTSGANTSYTIPATGSLILKYTATAPASQASNLQTTARGFVGVTEFGFAQNTVNVSTTLPVTLTAWNAVWVDNKIQLEWSTENENNSSHFEIERNHNATGFRKIGQLNAAANSSARVNYSFIDSTPGSGTNSYRLKMIDIDGQYKYSRVITMQNAVNRFTINSVYPNPFTNETKINLTVSKEQVILVSLFDKSGRMVRWENHVCNRGNNHIVLTELSQLPVGIYLLKIVSEEGTLTEKLVKRN
jgi:uncharacterized repeat protein (TIGR01451 family)